MTLGDFYRTSVQVFPSSGIRRGAHVYTFNSVRDKSRAPIFKVKHSDERGVTGEDTTLLSKFYIHVTVNRNRFVFK